MSDSRIILVTGGNRGIGYEAVKQLSENLPKSTILLSSRTTKNGEDAIAKMKEASPENTYDNVKVVELDIASQSSIDKAVAEIKQKYGKLDDLLHNSGISSHNGDPMSPHVLEVNIVGAKNTIESFKSIIPPKTGRIVLVSSEVGTWYTQAVDKATQAKLEDVPSNDWASTEKLIADWNAFAKGEKSDLTWCKTDNMLGQAYCTSKGILTAWARHFASTNPDHPLAIVCPGYCATELNGWSGPRSAAVGGTSVIWPLMNDFENGKLYQDGKVMAFKTEMPSFMTQ